MNFETKNVAFSFTSLAIFIKTQKKKLTVSQGNIVVEDAVPFLQDDFIVVCTNLSCYQFLQVTDRIVWIALNTHFLAQAIVAGDFNHVFGAFEYEFSSGK